MPKHYDDPQEIARMMVELKRLRQTAQRSPFTGLLTIFCYVLWKDYKYSQTKLAKFCEDFSKYDTEYDGRDITELDNGLWDYADWKVEFTPYTEKDYPFYKSPMAQKVIREQVKANNEINEKATRYLTYGFTVLMNDGTKKQKLTNIKDKIQKRIDEVTADERDKCIMDLWKELVDGAGIYIEKPVIE